MVYDPLNGCVHDGGGNEKPKCPSDVEVIAGIYKFAERMQADDLTIKAFHEANEARRRGDSGGGTEATWDLVDWTNELCGEAGELANLAKKVKRARPAKNGKKADPTLEEAKADLAPEIADVVICASLVAGHLGIDLEKAVREKFNIVSDRMGSDIKL